MNNEDLNKVLSSFDESAKVIKSSHTIQNQSVNIITSVVMTLRDEIVNKNAEIESLQSELAKANEELNKMKQKKAKKDEPIISLEPSEK
jgi:predicted  nucleic acid-binding Zn-ribbon protein